METLFVIPVFSYFNSQTIAFNAGRNSVSHYADYVCGAEKIKPNLILNPCNIRNMLVAGLEKWTVGWPTA